VEGGLRDTDRAKLAPGDGRGGGGGGLALRSRSHLPLSLLLSVLLPFLFFDAFKDGIRLTV
jgi:hypothetical protein